MFKYIHNLIYSRLIIFVHSHVNNVCDAPKPGGPLTTRQPAEYS